MEKDTKFLGPEPIYVVQYQETLKTNKHSEKQIGTESEGRRRTDGVRGGPTSSPETPIMT